MSDPLQGVARGERRRPSAATENALRESARAERVQRINNVSTVRPPATIGTTVRVKNQSGSAVRRFGVLALGEPVIPPSVNLSSFQSTPAFEGLSPGSSAQNFVVAQEPIAPGAIGTCVVSGVTPVQVFVDAPANENAYRYADVAIQSGTASLSVLEIGQAEIIWREAGTGLRWAFVRISNTPVNTVSTGTKLAIVRSPSQNGGIVASYTIDIYGGTTDSLFDPPTLAAQVAIQDPVENAYYLGEVVTVTTVGGQNFIGKLLTNPIAYTATAGQVCVRGWATYRFPSAMPTNMMIDLVDLLDFFDGGAQTLEGYAAFSFGNYSGLCSVGTTLSIPVRCEPSWTLCEAFAVSSSFSSAASQIAQGTVNSISSSQDLFGSISHQVPTGPSPSDFAIWAFEEQDFDPGQYVFTGLFGTFSQVNTLRAEVGVSVNGARSDDANFNALFPGAPALPSIPGGVDDGVLYLLAHARAAIYSASTTLTSNPPNKINPSINAKKAFPNGGGSIGDTYTTDLGGAGQVDPYVQVNAS